MFDDVAHDDGFAAEVGDACYLTELGGDDFWQACVAWGDVGAEVGCGEDVGIGVGGGGASVVADDFFVDVFDAGVEDAA